MRSFLNKSLWVALIVCTSQVHGYEYKDDSTILFADLLVWKLREGSTDNWAQEITPAGATRTANVLNVPFDYKAGVRVGITKKLSHDAWDAAFAYTWFQSNATSQASVTSGGIYSSYMGNFFMNNTAGATIADTPNYKNASIQWDFYFNTFDLELGRSFEIDHFLLLRPFIGIKTAIINQHIDSTWQNPNNAANFTVATENVKNDFWGIGPAIGLNSNWPLYKCPKYCFSLLGNFSGALLWGHWDFSDQYHNNAPASITINSATFNSAATMARGLLGVEWLGCLAKAAVTLRLGYEAQVWFNQVQYYSYNMGRLNNLMSLQGLVLGCGINF